MDFDESPFKEKFLLVQVMAQSPDLFGWLQNTGKQVTKVGKKVGKWASVETQKGIDSTKTYVSNIDFDKCEHDLGD